LLLKLYYNVPISSTAPYIPPLDPSNPSDTQNFDDTFLNMEPVINDENDLDVDQERERTDPEPTGGEDSAATPPRSRSSSAHRPNDLVDVFEGFWYEGQHSVIVDENDASEKVEKEEDYVTESSILGELNGLAATEI
jgi:serum/glucocorticoid-regulated kinase 2